MESWQLTVGNIDSWQLIEIHHERCNKQAMSLHRDWVLNTTVIGH